MTCTYRIVAYMREHVPPKLSCTPSRLTGTDLMHAEPEAECKYDLLKEFAELRSWFHARGFANPERDPIYVNPREVLRKASSLREILRTMYHRYGSAREVHEQLSLAQIIHSADVYQHGFVQIPANTSNARYPIDDDSLCVNPRERQRQKRRCDNLFYRCGTCTRCTDSDEPPFRRRVRTRSVSKLELGGR